MNFDKKFGAKGCDEKLEPVIGCEGEKSVGENPVVGQTDPGDLSNIVINKQTNKQTNKKQSDVSRRSEQYRHHGIGHQHQEHHEHQNHQKPKDGSRRSEQYRHHGVRHIRMFYKLN